jgi:hypothetical protein|nr:hypothetical protein [Kofleriaceae bacterium]
MLAFLIVGACGVDMTPQPGVPVDTAPPASQTDTGGVELHPLPIKGDQGSATGSNLGPVTGPPTDPCNGIELCGDNTDCISCYADAECASGPDPVWDGAECVCAQGGDNPRCDLEYCCAQGDSFSHVTCDCEPDDTGSGSGSGSGSATCGG